MTAEAKHPLLGSCDCGAVRYRLESLPMIVQCCHCYRCQKRTGSAFVINALIEGNRVSLLSGKPTIFTSEVENLNHQHLSQCSTCRVTLWSTFDAEGGFMYYVRVGTLDQPTDIKPDIHIYTSSKQPWVIIPDGVPSVTEYYERSDVWSQENLARRKVLEPLQSVHWDQWVIEARRKRKLAMENSGAAVESKSLS